MLPVDTIDSFRLDDTITDNDICPYETFLIHRFHIRPRCFTEFPSLQINVFMEGLDISDGNCTTNVHSRPIFYLRIKIIEIRIRMLKTVISNIRI